MNEPIEIVPVAGPLDATVAVPGSKSITNRALVAALLADGTSVLTNVLAADDTEAMLDAAAALGAVVTHPDASATVRVAGTDGRLAAGPRTIDARQAGTAARFLAVVLALGSGPYRLDAAPPMRLRPMGPLFDALRGLGATVTEEGAAGYLPAVILGGGLRGGAVEVTGDVSSQFLSGLLLGGPLMAGGLRVAATTEVVSRPYLDMTMSVMASFGVDARWDGPRALVVEPGRYRGATYAIEPDATAASYFLAAAAICGGRVTVPGLGRASTQGDLGFAAVLAEMGAHVELGDDAVTVIGTGTLRGVDVDMADISDTAQTLAAVAVFADGPTVVRGIGFIRRKETDRVGAVVAELRRCGINATEDVDGFTIVPGEPQPAVVETYGDHRMAMSFALLGLRAPGIRIADPSCVAKTFPGYWAALDRVSGSGAAPGGPPDTGR